MNIRVANAINATAYAMRMQPSDAQKCQCVKGNQSSRDQSEKPDISEKFPSLRYSRSAPKWKRMRRMQNQKIARRERNEVALLFQTPTPSLMIKQCCNSRVERFKQVFDGRTRMLGSA
jgi:hypothetical protein